MICEHCKQRNATVTVTHVQYGSKAAHHYCDVCAMKFQPFQFDMQEEPISLHQLMSNWFGFPTNASNHQAQQQALSCSSCGFTYRQFLKIGKFGCPTCYTTFRQQLPEVLQRIQADVKHVGYQQPEDEQNIIREKLDSLRATMQEAVLQERFEDAAAIRDEIKQLEKKMQHGGVNEA